MKDINEILNNPAIVLAPQVSSVLTEFKSNWAYGFKLRNTTNQKLRLAILTAGINRARIVTVTNGSYKGIGGANIEYAGSETLLILQDNPTLINKWTQSSIDAVATTTIDGQKQVVFANPGGYLSFENLTYNGGVDFLQNFVLNNPVRLFQVQINSNTVEQFSQKIIIKHILPFAAPVVEEINIEDYFKPLQNQNKVIIDRPFIVGANTILTIDVAPQSESTWTLKASVVYSITQKLNKETDIIDIANKLKTLKLI